MASKHEYPIYIISKGRAYNPMTANAFKKSNINFYIAVDPAVIPGRNFIGDIAIAMVYNTTLSLSDITTNFNAQKSRFGL